jgi:hypothetical protein
MTLPMIYVIISFNSVVSEVTVDKSLRKSKILEGVAGGSVFDDDHWISMQKSGTIQQRVFCI